MEPPEPSPRSPPSRAVPQPPPAYTPSPRRVRGAQAHSAPPDCSYTEDPLLDGGRSKLYQRRKEIEAELRREFNLPEEADSILADGNVVTGPRKPLVFGCPPPVPKPRVGRSSLPPIPKISSQPQQPVRGRWGVVEITENNGWKISGATKEGTVTELPWWKLEQEELISKRQSQASSPEPAHMEHPSTGPSRIEIKATLGQSAASTSPRMPKRSQNWRMQQEQLSEASEQQLLNEDADNDEKPWRAKARELEEIAKKYRQQRQEAARYRASEAAERESADRAEQERHERQRRLLEERQKELQQQEEQRFEQARQQELLHMQKETEEARQRRREQDEWEDRVRRRFEEEAQKRREAQRRDEELQARREKRLCAEREEEAQQRQEAQQQERERMEARQRQREQREERRRLEAQREEEARRQWEALQEELEREEEERNRVRAERHRQKVEQNEAREAARLFAEGEKARQREEVRRQGAMPSPRAPATSRRAGGAGAAGTSPRVPGGSAARSSSMPSSSSRKGDAITQAQAAAMQQLRALKLLPTQEARHKGFKDLLRAWHPDKNPQNVEVTTAVFQLLQAERGRMLNP